VAGDVIPAGTPGTCALAAGWRLQSAHLAGMDGAAISSAGFATGGWHAASAPTTVLKALVADGTYPDPRFAAHALEVPDASDEFNATHGLARFSHLPDGRNPWRDPWWFRTEFELAPLGPAQRAWLTLNSVNYRATVWVNGACVADRRQLVGMFRRFRLDVTGPLRAGPNVLAILVDPVDHPGVPDTQLQVFGPVRGFHKDICHDVTEVMSVGYDCFPTVPDRNLGLIQEVLLDTTGPVDLRDPFVRCALPLPALRPARLTVSADLLNATPRVVSARLEGVVAAPDTGQIVASFARPVVLLGHQTLTVTVAAAEADGLLVAEPRLWWPNTCGAQPLYELTLRVVADGVLSASARTRFGIRRLDRELCRRDGAHGFRLRVNGERVFQRGGYVQPEMMFAWDPARVRAELQYLAAANLNYVVFEDIPNPPDWYLDLCDELGLMFWNCFYGCYWLQPDRRWNVDLAVLEDCTADVVKRYRNHPSLVLYMAQNEGETRRDVYAMWRRTVLGLDDTRFLVPSGSFPDYRTDVPEWIRGELPAGMNDYPPKSYGWQLPWTYYRFVREHRNWMFMIESGAASVPPWESLVRFVPGLRELPPNSGSDPAYPLDAAWAHHGANSYYEWFDRGLRLLYGEPRDARDYVWKAQLLSYDQHRALFEAVHHRLWDLTSGFGQWKLNSAFPDVQWQLYDWFLRPMPSLYAVRKACARLAVQLSPLDGTVAIVNNGSTPAAGLTVTAVVHDLALGVLHRHAQRVEAPANAVCEAFAIPRPAAAAQVPVYFVKLTLRDEDGALLADNFYWLSPRLDDPEIVFTGDMHRFPANRPLALPRQTPCFPELAALPATRLDVTAALEPAPRAAATGGRAVRVRLANAARTLAFFVRVRLLRAADGEEVLPVYWSDNYFSLLPGEVGEIVTPLAAGSGTETGGALQVAVDGWNVVPLVVDVAT